MASAFIQWLMGRKCRTVRRQGLCRQGRGLLVEQLESREMLSGNPPLPLVPQVPGATASSVYNPIVLASPNGTPGPVGFTPAQIQHAYGFDQLPGTALYPSTDYNTLGTGQTIAIIDWYDSPTMRADLQAFDEQFGITGLAGDASNTDFFTEVNEYGGSTLPTITTSDLEIALDVEWAHAIAPGANILLVEANSNQFADLDTAIEYAANYPGVSAVSMSFGGSELYTQFVVDSVYTTPLGHTGVSFIASAGDTGTPDQQPSDSPNVLSVGGTTLTLNPDNTIATEAGWTYGSDSWNGGLAGGGGVSIQEAQPAYQQGNVNGISTSARTNPDVAYDSDPATGFPVYDAYALGDSTPWQQVGGTSDAAPQWAGLIAIVNQGRAAVHEAPLDGPSQLLPAVYQIANSDPTAFNDITTDTTGSGNPYHSGPGYDLVTGEGTPNVPVLVPDLVNAYSTPALPQTVYWTGAADNNWDNPGNWSLSDPASGPVVSGVLPDANSNVVVDLSGVTISHGTTDYYYGLKSYDTIRSLTVTGSNVTLFMNYGTLDVGGSGARGSFQVDQAGDLVYLAGGELRRAVVTSGTTITATSYYSGFAAYGGVLDEIQLDGTLDMNEFYNPYLAIQGGMVLHGTIEMGADGSAVLYVGETDNYIGWYDNNPESITGTGSMQLSGSAYIYNMGYRYSDYAGTSHATFIIGPQITLNAGSSYNWIGDYYSSATDIDNQGTFQDNNGGNLTISASSASSFINDGTVTAGSGGYVYVFNPVNNGQITGDAGSTFDLYSAINNGQITANLGSIVYFFYTWTNNATITAADGATLNLFGNWTNFGTITVGFGTVSVGAPTYGTSPALTYDDSSYLWNNVGTITITTGTTVYLGGFFTIDTFRTLFKGGQVLSGDTVYLTGSLDASAIDNPISRGVLVLDASTGPLNLLAGYIDQGTIVTNGANDLVGDTSGYAYLNAVTLDGTLDMTQSAYAVVYIRDGLTLNGTIDLGGQYGTSNQNNTLYFGNGYDNYLQTIDGAGSIVFGQDASGDSIYNLSNEPLTIGSNITIAGGLNSFIYTSSGSESSIQYLGTVEESTVVVPGSGPTLFGSLQIDGAVANYSAGTLTGGTWQVANGASIALIGDPITTNAATIALSGAGSAIYSDAGTTYALAGLLANVNGGTFIVDNGSSFSASGDFANSGNVTVAAGGAFDTAGSNYIQTGGSTTVDGTLSGAAVMLNGGTLNGDGTVQAAVTNAATISPGDGVDTLTITGDYTQTAAGALDVAVGGHGQSGPFSQLAISGTATLAGTLNVSFTSGFTPDPGDDYPVLTFHSKSGDFSTETGLAVSGTLSLSPVYDSASTPNNLSLRTVGVPTVSINGGPFTYDGSGHGASVSVTGFGSVHSNPSGNTVVTYSSGSYGPSTTPPTNAGTYTVHVTFTSTDAHYTNATAMSSITISPKVLNAAANGVNKVYDGTTATTVTFSDNRVAGDQLTYSDTAEFVSKDVGTAKTVNVTSISISGPSAGNYVLSDTSTTASANITPANLTVTGITAGNKVYDATTNATLNVSGATLGGVQGTDVVTLHTSGAIGTFASKDFGTAIGVAVSGLTVSGAAVTAGDYTLTQPGTSANITARTLTVSGVTASNKVYDSNLGATLNVGAATLVGVQDGDSVTLNTGTALGTFASKDVGTGINVAVSGLSISGATVTAGDYTLTQPTTSANITPRSLTVTGITADNKVYDAGTDATLKVGGATLQGVQGTDLVTLNTASAVGTSASSNVGTGITVTITGVSVSGTDVTAGDYALTQPTTTANITPRTLTVSGITAAGKVYDGGTGATLNLTGATLGGVQGTDVVTLNTGGAMGAFASKDVGTGIGVTISGLTISGAPVAAGDYTLTEPTTTGDITSRGLTVSGVTAANKVYDVGTAATLNVGGATLVGVQAGDAVSLNTGSATGTFASKDVSGGVTVTITGVSISGPTVTAGDYTLTQPSTTADITPHGLTVSGITADNKVYDGGTDATLNVGGAILVGVQGTDLVTLDAGGAVGTFASKDVGTGISVAITGLTVSGLAVTAGDYTLTQPTTTANITPRGLTVTGVTANNKMYDGGTGVTLNLGGAALAGVQGTDVVTLNTANAIGAFASRDVGVGMSVAIFGLSVSGTAVAAGDYTLTQPTSTANITPRALSVSGVTAANKAYDGGTTATLNLASAMLVGVQGSDAVTLNTAGATGTFASSDVGTGIAVAVAGLGISGSTVTAGDYTLTQPTTTANITARTLTVFGVAVADKVYDGGNAATPNFGSATLVGVQGTDAVTLNTGSATATFASINVGTGIAVAIAGLSISGTTVSAGDYTLAQPSTSASITAAPTSTTILSAPTVTSGAHGFVTVSVALAAGAPAGAGSPTGSVSLAVDGGTLIVQPLVNGSATFDVGVLPVGDHSLNAGYAAQGNFGASASSPGNLLVNSAVNLPSVNLAGATVSQLYSQAIVPTGGTGAVTLAVTAGALPADLTLNPTSGTITGSPRTAGAYAFTITATDALGSTVSQTYSMLVNPPSWTLKHAGYNQAISEARNATFKLAPLNVLPTGVKLSAAGVLTGTPTKAGTFTFTVAVTDVATGLVSNQAYTITINPALVIATKHLANSTANVSGYSGTIAVTGGTGAVTFKVATGKLPPGLAIDPLTGAITGTPTTAGRYIFSILATDSVGTTTKLSYTVTIAKPPIHAGRIG
jgi:hypothetical protein